MKTTKKEKTASGVQKTDQGPGVMVDLPMEKVIPTPDNPRRPTVKDKDVIELAESIRTSGLLEPVICRPHPTKKGCYDLRAGAMRYAAHQLIGAKTILAIIKNMDDATAIRVMVLENLQRVDLTALQEGQGVKKLIAAGGSLREIGAQVGKSYMWVARRARLADLIPAWVKRFKEHGSTDAGAMELIARYDADEQTRLLRDFPSWRRVGRTDIQDHLNERECCLARTPWDHKDATLTATAGSCFTCTKRTSARAVLFHDTDDPAEARKNDRCLDRKCWEAKRAAALEKKEKELRAEHPKLVKIDPDRYQTENGILGYNNYTRTKKDAAGAVPALIVGGGGTGTLTWIKPNRAGQPKTTEPQKTRPRAERREELMRIRWKRLLSDIATLVAKHDGKHLTDKELLTLAAVFSCQGVCSWENKSQDWKKYLELLHAKDRAVLDRMWESTRHSISARLGYWQKAAETPDHLIEEAKTIADLLKINWQELYRKISEEPKFRDPPGWAKTRTDTDAHSPCTRAKHGAGHSSKKAGNKKPA